MDSLKPTCTGVPRWQDSDGSDLRAAVDETRDRVIGFYRRTWEQREGRDGRTGVRAENEQRIDEETRAAHRARIEQAARTAAPVGT